jgi:hypothetical protein
MHTTGGLRPDYQLIAEVLRDAIDDPSLRAMVALEFVDRLKQDNPQFDETAFLNATKRNTGRKWYYQGFVDPVID